jgi:signal transduction histidine kinase
MLSERSGLETLSTARSHALRTPVLILTARDAVEDRVVGLDSGADDYLVKPFVFPELQARVGADDQAVLEVEDHGPGIPPEHRLHIFERFYRVDQARLNETGGAGLGLWISKWAIEANGGAIELRSEGGQGCVFRISLPLAGAHRPGNTLVSV